MQRVSESFRSSEYWQKHVGKNVIRNLHRRLHERVLGYNARYRPNASENYNFVEGEDETERGKGKNNT
jgi:hypothetical protein